MRRTLPFLTFFLVAAAHEDAWPIEPSVDDTRAAALQQADLAGPLDRWSTRQRLRNLLPEISVSVGRSDQRDDGSRFDEWLVRDADDSLLWDSARNHTELDLRRRLDFTIRATIDLRGLVYESDELNAAREIRAHRVARQSLIDDVHAAYFARHAAMDALREADPRDFETIATLEIGVAELDARLDGLTGGWFSKQLRRSR